MISATNPLQQLNGSRVAFELSFIIVVQVNRSLIARKKQKMSKGRVQGAYDELGGELYDLRYTGEQEEKYTWVLSKLRVREQDIIVDVGCGTGLFLQTFQNYQTDAVGLDLSVNMISWAKGKLQKSNNVHLVLSDADYLPFKTEVFSCFFAFTLLQNVPNPHLTLAEALLVTKKRAPVVISGLKRRYESEQFFSMLRSSGLRIVRKSNEQSKDYIAICARE